jgi:HSP20 family protein
MSAKAESLRELVQLQRKMNQLFDEMLQPDRPHHAGPEYSWVPAADVYEDAGHYHVELELPGVQIADVDLVCEGNLLRVTGERKPLMELTRESVQRMERYLGPFGREFSFPEALDPAHVEARLQDGVLSVKISKRERRAVKVK